MQSIFSSATLLLTPFAGPNICSGPCSCSLFASKIEYIKLRGTELIHAAISLLIQNNVTCSKTHPRRPRGSQSAREKRWDESFQVRAKEPLGTNSHQTISKNSSGYRLLIGHKKCFVLLCPIGEQFLLSSFREFVHDSYCLATLARFVHQACAYKGNFYFLLSQPETKELPMSRKNVWDAISRSN